MEVVDARYSDERESDDNSYLLGATCYNCGTKFLTKQLKGRTARGPVCPYCNCGGFPWKFSFWLPDANEVE